MTDEKTENPRVSKSNIKKTKTEQKKSKMYDHYIHYTRRSHPLLTFIPNCKLLV